MKTLIDKLYNTQNLTHSEFLSLLENFTDSDLAYLGEKAREVSYRTFKNHVYTRALIEISSYCKNDCYYCGIRCGNKNAQRYRLDKADILECCQQAYELGFKTFVLQGGEDPHFTDEVMVDIISSMKERFPDCAVTLSIGERSFNSYNKMFLAGADRYLLRHETITKEHYQKLHPDTMDFYNRVDSLENLMAIGYQVGCGIMVGSPFQTMDNIVCDLEFIKEFHPHMVGIGPFIPHHDTPFKEYSAGSVKLTLLLLGIIRLMLPTVLLPATTALGTVCDDGREQGVLMGANVVMPNFSPVNVRSKYALYDNKLATGNEAGENKRKLVEQFAKIGYEVVDLRGDSPDVC